ncbi:hypothetical protein CN902_09505 [Priestia megaterium]|uniref:glycosyltransferase family 4 protein n=1 Tax=Priestia megaterium TaxID=1404 RepID=UPI000BFB73BF|nr:glycosyltransferase family 4 protein [Priestia megaterium]PGK31201.1 hypothetical protein CN902_09505 [Priestia megaterium]
MKVLLSAYSCEPGSGSEPGVGWNWAINIARRGDSVWVLTRKVHRERIEQELKKDSCSDVSDKLHFVYYDMPFWERKKGGKFAQIHYLMWQYFILKESLALNKKVDFDAVHHITFGVFRHPSYLYFLGKPFFFGPVGGGETSPKKLRKALSIKNQLKEQVRDIINLIAYYDPLLRLMYKRTSIIYCKTLDTMNLIPKKFHYKTKVFTEIGMDNRSFNKRSKVANNKEFRVLFVGRLIYWKGAHLALEAFARFSKIHNEAKFYVIGDGEEKVKLMNRAKQLGISDSVEWTAWIDQHQLLRMYAEHDVFLFPSLHDSSGNVVLEAINNSLPVICLDVGGPATIINDKCGEIIGTYNKTQEEVVENIKNSLMNLYINKDVYERYSECAQLRSSQFRWEKVVNAMYEEIERTI